MNHTLIIIVKKLNKSKILNVLLNICGISTLAWQQTASKLHWDQMLVKLCVILWHINCQWNCMLSIGTKFVSKLSLRPLYQHQLCLFIAIRGIMCSSNVHFRISVNFIDDSFLSMFSHRWKQGNNVYQYIGSVR